MAIDFTLSPDVEDVRQRVRKFMDEEVRPSEQKLRENDADRNGYRLRHRPDCVSGRTISACGTRTCPRSGAAWASATSPWRSSPRRPGARAWARSSSTRRRPTRATCTRCSTTPTTSRRRRYLRPLAEGRSRSCFAMTEPEVAGSDPTGIQTTAVKDGDDWVINGHKWFISGAKGARFAILIARTDPDADPPQARNSAFLVDLPAEGWEIVRDIDTMAGVGNHCEIRITDLRVPAKNMLGERGHGHLLGQYRLGPARLAHCMRWIGNAEVALEMLVDRALKRESHGSLLADKQAIQWMMADSAMELYAGKLMVLARGVQDRERPAVQAGSLVRQAPRREHALEDRRPRDPGARRARLLNRYAA